MKKYVLDFTSSRSVEEIHSLIAKVCGFPAHYGANLDALQDSLSGEMETPAEFIISGKGAAIKNSGAKASAIFDLIEEYADENPDELKIVYR